MTRDGTETRAARRRLRGFLGHLAAYFLGVTALVGIDYAVTPDDPWFVWPMVGWGGLLAIHVAYVMGLFRGLFGRRDRS